MPDVSPTKWHRAHTSWFFETFLLAPHLPGYRVFDPAYAYLFNSYYEAVGARHPRPQRGLVSRPGIAEIGRYRAHVDAAMAQLIATLDPVAWAEAAPLIELGLNHEEQHQELILMDIKHVLSLNPLQPAYAAPAARQDGLGAPPAWLRFAGGLRQIGYGGGGFAFANEKTPPKGWVPALPPAGRRRPPAAKPPAPTAPG